MSKVSVLIAAYNASQYLPACLDSLLMQTHSDFQAICIDDGSTDDTLQILQAYSRKDARIEVIHLEENRGQAHARNVGLQQAKGDYVCFLDADDWFEANTLSQAVSVFAEHPLTDAVLFQVSMDYDTHSERYEMPAFESLSGSEAFRMSLTWQIHGVYMVRTAIHQQYPYDETCKSYSDDNSTRLHFITSREVRCCQGVYHYRQHASSVTHAVSVRRFDYLRANESMKQALQRLGVDRDVLALYENHRWLNLVGVYMFYFVHYKELSATDAEYGLSELHRVWRTIDRSLLTRKTTLKLGYCPMPWWWLFRCEEWLYFTLRGLMGKNKES